MHHTNPDPKLKLQAVQQLKATRGLCWAAVGGARPAADTEILSPALAVLSAAPPKGPGAAAAAALLQALARASAPAALMVLCETCADS